MVSIKIVEYQENKEQHRAVDVASVLADMEDYEQYYGPDWEKHWFSLKRNLIEAATAKKEDRSETVK